MRGENLALAAGGTRVVGAGGWWKSEGTKERAGRSDCRKQVNIFMKEITLNFGLVS